MLSSKVFRLTFSTYPLLALCLSASLLCGAWIFQYGFGYAPCTVCYWQRDAHKAIIVLAIIALGVQKFFPQKNLGPLFRILLILAFLGSAAVAFYHVGVEQLWWEGPKTCATGTLSFDQAVDFLAELDKKIKPPACKDVVWSLFGVSMAGYNMLASLLSVVLGLWAKPK